jgi:hypothetical protein
MTHKKRSPRDSGSAAKLPRRQANSDFSPPLRDLNGPHKVCKFQIFRHAADGTLRPVRGLVFTLLSSAEQCIARSREPLKIRQVRP